MYIVPGRWISDIHVPGALLWLKIGTRLWVPVKISWGEVRAMEVGEVRLVAWRDGETNWKRKDQVNGGDCTPCKRCAYSSDAGCECENCAGN